MEVGRTRLILFLGNLSYLQDGVPNLKALRVHIILISEMPRGYIQHLTELDKPYQFFMFMC